MRVRRKSRKRNKKTGGERPRGGPKEVDGVRRDREKKEKNKVVKKKKRKGGRAAILLMEDKFINE